MGKHDVGDDDHISFSPFSLTSRTGNGVGAKTRNTFYAVSYRDWCESRSRLKFVKIAEPGKQKTLVGTACN